MDINLEKVECVYREYFSQGQVHVNVWRIISISLQAPSICCDTCTPIQLHDLSTRKPLKKIVLKLVINDVPAIRQDKVVYNA